MSKLRLNVEELAVESFVSEPEAGTRGTVLGRSYYTFGGDTCDGGMQTCDFLSCDGACGSHFCPPVGSLSCGGCVSGYYTCGVCTGGQASCGGPATCACPATSNC